VIGKALVVQWGWTKTEAALPFALSTASFAVMMVFAGRMQDRFGPRWVAAMGGVLFGQETTSGPEPRSVLTIKVLPANFAAAMERLAGLGTLVSQTVYADDVTERVVDLQSRITTAEASVERPTFPLNTATHSARRSPALGPRI